jgi:hypothetical protein
MNKIDSFVGFWRDYPSRNGVRARKQEALAAWLKLKPDDALYSEIMAGLTRYKKVCGDFPVDAVRFLRHKRWTDEITEVAPRVPDEPIWERQARKRVEETQAYIAELRASK